MMEFARRHLVVALFLLSGVTGLVYEVLWARQLGVVLGNAAHAHAVVLATFMGGLALGNAWLGRLGDRTASPLRLYGRLELGVALLAGISPSVLQLTSGAYLAAAPALDPTWRVVAKAVVAAAALLPATILMGGTLPILARYVTESLAGLKASVASLYCLNSAGAAVGALLAAFWLIPAYGTTFPVVLAAFLNAAIGVVAIAIDRYGDAPAAPPQEVAPPPAVDDQAPADAGRHRALLFVAIGLAGFASMVMETVWIRLLSIATTSSSYSFAVMLAAFIGGIALGSWLIRRLSPGDGDPLWQFGLAEAGAGLAVLLTLPFYEWLPYLFLRTSMLLRPVPETFLLVEGVKAAMSLLLMLPPTILIGMTLPLASRAAARTFGEVGSAVGRVFATNTLGNVAGALVGGLVLLPLIGMRNALELAAVVALLVGCAAATARLPLPRRAMVLAGAVAGFGLYRVITPPWDVALANFGATRWQGPAPKSFEAYKRDAVGHVKVVFHADDAHATVVVLDRADGNRTLKVNGKPDASTGADDMATQVSLGHLPPLLAATPRRGLIVGLGAGVSAGAALAHPLERLDVVEISSAVVQGARYFEGANRKALDDPRLRLHVDDAFHHLAVVPDRYDFIMSEPSNPWVAGVSHLYTSDFYTLAKQRLAPGGVFVQWLHTYMSNDEAVALILRTMADAFPHVELWQARNGSDLMLVGAMAPIDPNFAALGQRLARPAVAQDLARIGIQDLPTLLSLQIASDPRVRDIAGEGPINSLVRPRLEVLAPVAYYTRSGAHAVWQRDERLEPDGDSRARLALTRYLQARGHGLSTDEFGALFQHHSTSVPMMGGRNPGLAVLYAWHAQHPDDPVARWFLAEALGKTGQPEAAAATAESLAQRSPKKAEVLLKVADMLGEAYFGRRSAFNPLDPAIEKALALYAQALKAPQVDRAAVYERVALLAAAAGRLDESLAAREGQAAQGAPAARAKALLEAALAAYDAGQPTRAASYARRVLAFAPDDPRARQLLGALEAPTWRR